MGIALDRRAHGIAVVLAYEQNRQLPESGEIQTLVELAFRRRAVAKEAGGDLSPALHLVGQCQPHREGQAAAHDRIATVETVPASNRCIEPPRPPAGAFLFAVHFGHHGAHRDAADQRLAVLAISRHNGVVAARAPASRRPHSPPPRLQMKKAANLLGAVELGATLLEAADAEHPA